MELEESNNDLNLKTIYEYPIEYFVNENKILKTQIKNLTSEMNYLREDNYRLSQNLISKEGELFINKSALENSQKLCNDIDSKFSSLRSENSQIRDELLKSIEDKNFWHNEKDSLNREKEILNLEIKDARNEIFNKLKEMQNYQQQIEQLTNDKLNLSSDLVSIRGELANEKYSLERITNELNQLRNEFLAKEKSFAIEKQNYNLTITNMNDLMKESKENVIVINKKSEEAIFKITQEKNHSQSENERLNLKIQENDLNLQMKSKKIEELGNVIIELKKHIVQSENEAKILREIITDKEIEISNLYKIKIKYDSYISLERNLERDSNFLFNDDSTSSLMIKDEFKKISAIKEKIQKDLYTYREQNEKYKNELNNLHDIKFEYDKISAEYEKLYKEYNYISQLNEKNEMDVKEYKNEIEILNQLVEKLSKQNRALLYEIRLKEPGKNFLSQNLNKEKYEEFIYHNISDIEPRLSELMKRNISLNLELNSHKEIISRYESDTKEKKEVMKNLEDYLKNLEETNSNLKKEYETLRFYSDSHYHLFTLNFSKDENLLMEKIQELKDNLKEMNVSYQSALREKEKSFEDLKKIQNQFDELNNKNFELKNFVYNKDIELNRLKMEAANYSEIQKNHLNLLDIKENEIKILKSELYQVKNSNSQNLKEKEELIKNLSQNLNQNNLKLNETNNYFRSQMEKLFNENVALKKVYEEFTKSFIAGEILDKKTNSRIISDSLTSSNNDNITHEELSKKLETIKSNLLAKDEEIFKLKESKSEIEIKIENILTENSSLKYKNEFLQRRIKFFKNLLQDSQPIKNETNFSMRIKRNPIFKEKKFKVTEISMNEPERLKEYSINVNEEVDSNYEIIQENINENVSENVDENMNENLEYKFNFNEELSQKYLEAINSIQKFNSENLLLRYKLNELNQINLNLVKNDLTAPYVYLFKKIEDLSNQNVNLENENKSLNEQKLKIVNDYSFINLQNELIKKNEENQIKLNKELIEKVKNLENTLEEKMKHSILYANSQIVINEKDAVINSLLESKDEMTKKLQACDSSLAEKNEMIQNLESQIKIFEENKENEFKNLNEANKKELTQSKLSVFKNFYVCFKRSKNLIETFVKLKEILEEKIEKLENENKKNDLSSYITEFNSIYSRDQHEINELKKRISHMEITHSEIVANLTTEIGSYRAKEKSFVNEIKTFKNINQFEGSLDLKNYFTKLLRNMHSSMNIINFQNEKMKDLELQNQKLKDDKKRSEENATKGVNANVHAPCEKCKVLNLEVKALIDNNKRLSQRLNEEAKVRKEIEVTSSKTNIEKDILMNDVKKISQLVREDYDRQSSKIESSNIPQSQIEKNKTFSVLINQMRKASKIISFLEKSTKDLNEEGVKLLKKEK